MNTKRRLRFAVIGQGYFAQAAVLPAFEQASGCELRAIFSQDKTKLRALRRKYDVAAALGYDEYDDYLRSGEIDAIYIALPNDMHHDYTVRAARAGVHVLCEKPIATNSHDAERMIAACAENGVKLMVAYRLHFEDATLEAIERVQRGDMIGTKGRIRLDPAYDYATGLTLETEVANRRPQRKTFPKSDQIAAELTGFARSIRDRREPEPCGQEGLADLRVLEAIQRSTESGRMEAVAQVARKARPSKAQAIRRKPHDMPDLVNVEAPGR